MVVWRRFFASDWWILDGFLAFLGNASFRQDERLQPVDRERERDEEDSGLGEDGRKSGKWRVLFDGYSVVFFFFGFFFLAFPSIFVSLLPWFIFFGCKSLVYTSSKGNYTRFGYGSCDWDWRCWRGTKDNQGLKSWCRFLYVSRTMVGPTGPWIDGSGRSKSVERQWREWRQWRERELGA